MQRPKRITSTAAGLAALLLVGCVSQPKVRVVDLSPGRLQPGVRVRVDGKGNETAWSRAVAVPFEKTGSARFLWDDARLYGLISKFERQRCGFDLDEQICASITVGQSTAKLFFEENRDTKGDPVSLVLREAWSSSSMLGGDRHPLPAKAIVVASAPSVASQGFDWHIEFSLDWRCLSETPPEIAGMEAMVYRLVPQRPITHRGELAHRASPP